MPIDTFQLFWAEFPKSEIPKCTKPQIYHHFVKHQCPLLFFPQKVLNYMFNGLLFGNHMHKHTDSKLLFPEFDIVVLYYCPSFPKVIPSIQLLFRNFNVFIFYTLFKFRNIFEFFIFDQVSIYNLNLTNVFLFTGQLDVFGNVVDTLGGDLGLSERDYLFITGG